MKERLWSKNFIIACVAYFLIGCSFNLLMPTIPLYLSNDMGVPSGKIGLVLASYGVGLLLIRPFSGYLVDVYARKPLLIFGLSLFVLVFAGYYFVSTILFFVVIRFIHGLFWGLSTVSVNTVACIIPASRRSEGIGFFGVNINIAMAIAPYIAVIIYDASGFKTLISASLFMGFLSIIAALFISVPQRKRPEKRPAISFDRFILTKAIPIFLNQLLLAFGWGTLIAYAVLYGKEIGIHNSGVFFLFLAGGIVLSRVTSGKMVDRGYLHIIMAIAILMISAGYFCFALFHNILSFSISAFIIGIGYGTLFPALQTIYNNMAAPSRRGTANSTYLTSFDVGIGLGMLIGAYIAQLYGYANMYVASALISFASLFIYWFNSRKIYERFKVI